MKNSNKRALIENTRADSQCEQCKTIFKGIQRPNPQKYCSRKCNNKANNEKRRIRNLKKQIQKRVTKLMGTKNFRLEFSYGKKIENRFYTSFLRTHEWAELKQDPSAYKRNKEVVKIEVLSPEQIELTGINLEWFINEIEKLETEKR